MRKMNILLLPILLLLISCEQDTPTSVSPSAVQTDITLAKNPNIDAFDMVDTFSGSGAKGNGFVKVIDGQMDLTIHARNLLTNYPYEVHVAVGAVDDCDNFAPVTVHKFDITTDKNGKFNFKELGFDLGLVASGSSYRLDYIVVDPLDGPDFCRHRFFVGLLSSVLCDYLKLSSTSLYSKHIEKGQTQPSLEVEVITLDKPVSSRTRWLI